MDRNSIRSAYAQKDYPELNLEEGEVVEHAFKRAKICYVMIWSSIGIIIFLTLLAALASMLSGATSNQTSGNFILFITITIIGVLVICGIVGTIVYKHNKLFVTNKRVTQFTMASPIITSVNIIDLSSIEDVSFRQNKIVEKIFRYGTLRLSTVGDETTYTFPCVKVTPQEISHIVKLVNDDKEKNNH